MSADLDRYTQDMIAQGSRSFARAARLFSARERRSALRLYAWCRYADDLIDGQQLGHGQRTMQPEAQEALLRELRLGTRAALQGEPVEVPALRALQSVAREHGIGARYPFELLEGFAMDAQSRRYDTLDDLLLYCYRVAGVVGVMMAQIMGVTEARILERAMDLGIAFQLTNIARDVVEDAKAGRLYLPRQWLTEARLPEAELADEGHRATLHGIAQRLIVSAEPYYASARLGIPALPYRSAWAIATALAIYRDIGTRLQRLGPQAWNQRTVTPSWQKSWRVAQGAVQAALAKMRAAGMHRAGNTADHSRHQADRERRGLWSPSEALAVHAA